MNKELSINFEVINDDILMDTFSQIHSGEFMDNGYYWRGVDSSDRILKNEDAVDKSIYKVLSKLYKSK